MSTKLLLADDSPTIAKILKMALQSEAYEIRSVENAQDALSELRTNTPEIFLVDLTLPGKSGYEFAKLIRSDSQLNNIRVVLLSSAFDPADDEKVKANGADLVVVKPFDPSELRNALRLLNKSSPNYPTGSNVKGAVSGENIGESVPSTNDFPTGQTGTADDILSSLNNNSPQPAGTNPNFITQTVIPDLDKSLMIHREEHVPVGSESVLDLTGSFSNTENPTTMIEFGDATDPGHGAIADPVVPKITLQPLPTVKPPASKGIAPMPSAPQVEKKSIEPTDPSLLSISTEIQPAAQTEDLSTNAKALAVFFEAEISKHILEDPVPASEIAKKVEPVKSVDPVESILNNETQEPENFDASLASIDWASPPAENLNNWSSSTISTATKPNPNPKPPMPAVKPIANPKPPEPKIQAGAKPEGAQKISTPAKAPARPAPQEFSGTANALFDTGGSNFRFSPDYVNRITRAFTGDHLEEVPEKHISVFPKESHDASPASNISKDAGGGAWTDKEVQKIEQLVKDEVQMVVREVVEKIAWEVIPELAENLIKKELEKVLKQLDN